MLDSRPAESATADVLPYASPPQQPRPWFRWFAWGAAASIVAGLVILTMSSDGGRGRPRYGGGSLASYGNPDRRTTTCVVTQHDARQNLLLVIAWTAERGGGSTSRSGQNLLVSIHERPVRPSLKKKALYALQPDYTLREILMTEPDRRALFDELQKEGFHTSHSALWQKQVAPKLSKVEAVGGR